MKLGWILGALAGLLPQTGEVNMTPIALGLGGAAVILFAVMMVLRKKTGKKAQPKDDQGGPSDPNHMN